jgi:glycosyltransferase involved in cell wall biosynthesis
MPKSDGSLTVDRGVADVEDRLLALDHPRVLVLSSTRIGTESATGSAMSNFFRGWPLDRIAQLHTDGFTSDDRSVCERFFYFGSPLDRLRRRRWLRNLPRALGSSGRVWELVNYRAALQWARSQRPQVIYYRAVDDPRFYRWAPQRLARDLGVPMVTHIMDDWPARLLATRPKLGRRFDAALRAQFAMAASNLSICDRMSEGFADRYGVPFTALHNAIDADEWRGIERRRSVDEDGVFRIAYTGGLAADMCRRSVRDLADAVSALHIAGFPVRLDVWTPPWHRAAWFRAIGDRPGVTHRGFQPRAEYLQTLADADLLALPINFDDRSLTYIRYSMSNKAPEYMASGTPILAYGPAASATIDYARREGWARVVETRGVMQLAATIRVLLSDPHERRRLADHARGVALVNHDAATNRRRLLKILADAATSSGPARSPDRQAIARSDP